MIAWNYDPYDLSVHNTLMLNFAIDPNFFNFATLNINVAGATPAATMASEVAAKLNADPTFSTFFSAEAVDVKNGIDVTLTPPPYRVVIRSSGRSKTNIKAYITNAGAEQTLGFNLKAPVAELPSYYARHTIANRFNYPDSLGALVQLDTSNAVDQAVITNAGLDYTSPQADWQLLKGRSHNFMFTKNTVDGSNRITQSITYPAGSVAGSLAVKTTYSYTGANTTPSQSAQVPYVLTSGDLITP
jgi:hypothetical protein